MRTSVLIVFGLVALVCGYTVPGKKVKYADKDFLHKQKLIFELLQHVHQNEVLPKLYEQAKNYHIDQHYDDYHNVEKVKEFYHLYKAGFLPMNEIFSMYNEHHLKQFVSLYYVFYYAKSWDNFYQTALWARFHINEGMFYNAFTAAIIHRQDFAGLEVPAVYEIYPHYFFNSETIQTAQYYKMQGFYGMKKVEDVYTVIIPTNYTSVYHYNDYEQKLAYYREDVGLNAAYYYLQMDYPFWLGGKDFNLYKDRRGEFYLYTIQQILSRYYLERLSNDLGAIPEFSFDEKIHAGYYPFLRYYNGVSFPDRADYHVCYDYPENYYAIEKLYDYTQRIKDAIDVGYFIQYDGKHFDLRKPESIDYLGNLIQSNPDSYNYRYYGNIEALYRQIVGGTYQYHGKYQKFVPSAVEHFETAFRDPVFYQIYNEIVKFYYQFKDHLEPYKYNEIYYQGVKIESVEVDKLVTYFDKFDSDITNAVNVQVYDDKFQRHSDLQQYGRISHYNGEDFVIKARQWRLNHLPFTVKLNVYAETAATSMVRVFLGPKYDELGHMYEYTEHRENWYLLDMFKYDLVAGKNVITRESQDMFKFVKDRTTYFDLYKWVMTAEKGQTQFPLDMTEAHNGIPSRLMLPKGKKGGMPFQMYFIVSPYYAPAVEQFTGYDHYITSGIGSGARYFDSLPFGYPFDRKIDETVWFTPNMYYYDVNIFHKTEVEVNAVH